LDDRRPLRVLREPVHRSLRESVMSHFEQYCNVEREMTLRRHTLPLDLISRCVQDDTTPAHRELTRAGLCGANEAGLFRPSQEPGMV